MGHVVIVVMVVVELALVGPMGSINGLHSRYPATPGEPLLAALTAARETGALRLRTVGLRPRQRQQQRTKVSGRVGAATIDNRKIKRQQRAGIQVTYNSRKVALSAIN